MFNNFSLLSLKLIKYSCDFDCLKFNFKLLTSAVHMNVVAGLVFYLARTWVACTKMSL